MELLIRFWREIILVLLGIVLYWSWGVKIDGLEKKLVTAQVNEKLNEIQKDTLRQAITDQNGAVEKQRIDAVQRAEVFRVKSESIQAKYERERVRVRDLNGSQECDEIRKIIREAVE